MVKPLTISRTPSKVTTDTVLRPGTLIEYGSDPIMDGTIPYGGFGAYPIATNTGPESKSTTNTSPNPAYEAVRTLYNTHMLYDAHVYYNGRDPNLTPGSTKARTSSAGVVKPLTASATVE